MVKKIAKPKLRKPKQGPVRLVDRVFGLDDHTVITANATATPTTILVTDGPPGPLSRMSSSFQTRRRSVVLHRLLTRLDQDPTSRSVRDLPSSPTNFHEQEKMDGALNQP